MSKEFGVIFGARKFLLGVTDDFIPLHLGGVDIL